MSAGADDPVALIAQPLAEGTSPSVLGRYLFYNNSAFDGGNPAATAADDAAIAPNKQALLIGQTASFQNLSSYSRGINGVMIDVAGLTGSPTAADFEFQIGTSADFATWTTAPQPSAISVRHGAGVGGSARVSIVWHDHAIENTWLRVVVRANPSTGLQQADVFFFGNLVASAGMTDTHATVTIAQQAASRRPAAEPAPPTSTADRFDYNRDARVDATDEVLAREHLGSLAAIAPGLEFGWIIPAVDSDAPDVAAGPTDDDVTPTATPPELYYADFVLSDVVGRHVFYNNSIADGLDGNANAADDLAIATDKSALLPGSSATIANYTDSLQGINGVMVDIWGLPDVLTAADFNFRIGTAADLEQWTTAPAPSSITLRHGEGVNGSSRVTLIWPDGQIKNAWLEVTVKATPRTGLKAADVFYFGNYNWLSGNVTIGGLRSPWQSKDTRYDAPQFPTNLAPQPIAAPPVEPLPPDLPRQQPSILGPGDNGFHTSFAPAIVKAVDGTLLLFAQGRWGSFDHTPQAMILRRSSDNGVTWSTGETIISYPPNGTDIVGGAAPVVDEVTGDIFLPYTLGNTDVLLIKSTDNGLTWSDAVNITSSVKVTSEGNPNPAAFPDDPWGWYATGPGHGIQLKSGPLAGRLLVGGDHRLSNDTSGISWSHVIYSDDHGATWHLGGGMYHNNPVNNYSNECSLMEGAFGSLYMSIRHNESQLRGFSLSFDGGMTWTPMATDSELTTSPVHGSVLRVRPNTWLFAAPDSTNGTRHRMTIWVSTDNMTNWTKAKHISFDFAGYSDMVLTGPDTVLLAYNAGHANGYSADYMTMARFNLRWLLSPDDYEFHWDFNEEEPGSSTNIIGTTIEDASLWELRSGARANSAAEAPQYVAGAHAGDSALALTEGSDYVELTPARTHALQFKATESFTVEARFRTTDSDGVIVGTLPTGHNWSLSVVGGYLQFTTATPSSAITLTSTMRVDDGQWHRLVAVRDALTGSHSLWLDDLPAAPTIMAAALDVDSEERVTLGAYNNGTAQLAFEIDTLRVTRAAVAPADFLPADFVAPPRYPATEYPADAPTSIAGLKFWLPAYDPNRQFSGLRWSDPLPVTPVLGTATQSAYDASGNGYRMSMPADSREVLYDTDAQVGDHWYHKASGAGVGSEWIVKDSNGASPGNFNFVQNTGVFTLSTFIKPGPPYAPWSALFDNSQGSSANSGFTMSMDVDGSIGLTISGPSGTARLNATTPDGLVTQNTWYHVAVVGNGAGQPVTFYVTPVTASTVAAYTSGATIGGADGNYPAGANFDLRIGALANNGFAAYHGDMVDQAIFDRALTPQEIQQLFDYTKKP
ncbi:MAG: LamG-like jellyroll fold domain-containing protein [Pirellulales bacterium]